MYDFDKLNKNKPPKIELILDKNEKIGRALKILIKTAYDNHNLETDERNKKLVMCLDDKAKFLIDQMSDDTFKDNLYDNLVTYIKKYISVPDDIVEELKTQITEVIDSAVSEINTSYENDKSSDEDSKTKTKQIADISGLTENIINFSKKLYINNITYIQNTNSKRINILKNEFTKGISTKELNIESTVKQKNISLISRVTSGFGRLVQEFINNNVQTAESQRKVKNSISQIIDNRFKKVITYIKDVKNKISNGIDNIKKQGIFKTLLKSLFSIVKIITRLITGILGGLLKLVTGIIKLGINIVRGAVKLITSAVKTIFKLASKIVSGILKLTTGFLKKIKNFFYTPVGAYVLGFIVGYVGTKIKNWFDKAKDTIQEKLHGLRMRILKFLFTKEMIQRLNKLDKMKNNTVSFRTKAWLFGLKLSKFFSKTTIAIAAGTTIGAIIGRIIGSIASIFFAPLAPVLPGITTAIGALIGEQIGKSFDDVPQISDQSTKNKIINELLTKYHKKEQHVDNIDIKSTRTKLLDKVRNLERQKEQQNKTINNNSTDKEKEEARKKIEELNKELSKTRSVLDSLQVTTGTADESDSESTEHWTLLSRLDNLLQSFYDNQENKDSIFPDYGFSVRSLVQAAGNKDYKAKERNNSDNIPDNIILAQDKIKAACLKMAIDQYWRGNIPFDKIIDLADRTIEKLAREVNINTVITKTENGESSSSSDNVDLLDFIQNKKYKKEENITKEIDITSDVPDYNDDFDNYADKEYLDQISIFKEVPQELDRLSDELTDNYIDSILEKIQDKNVKDKLKKDLELKRKLIKLIIRNFLSKNGITNIDDLNKLKQTRKSDIDNLFNGITDMLKTEDVIIQVENDSEKVESKLLTVLDELKSEKEFTLEQNKEWDDYIKQQSIDLNIDIPDIDLDRQLNQERKENIKAEKEFRQLAITYAQMAGINFEQVLALMLEKRKEEEVEFNPNAVRAEITEFTGKNGHMTISFTDKSGEPITYEDGNPVEFKVPAYYADPVLRQATDKGFFERLFHW